MQAAIRKFLKLNISYMPWLHDRLLTDKAYACAFTKLFKPTDTDLEEFFVKLDFQKIRSVKIAQFYLEQAPATVQFFKSLAADIRNQVESNVLARLDSIEDAKQLWHLTDDQDVFRVEAARHLQTSLLKQLVSDPEQDIFPNFITQSAAKITENEMRLDLLKALKEANASTRMALLLDSSIKSVEAKILTEIVPRLHDGHEKAKREIELDKANPCIFFEQEEQLSIVQSYIAGESLASFKDVDIARALTSVLRDTNRANPGKEAMHYQSLEQAKLVRIFFENLAEKAIPQLAKLSSRTREEVCDYERRQTAE